MICKSQRLQGTGDTKKPYEQVSNKEIARPLKKSGNFDKRSISVRVTQVSVDEFHCEYLLYSRTDSTNLWMIVATSALVAVPCGTKLPPSRPVMISRLWQYMAAVKAQLDMALASG